MTREPREGKDEEYPDQHNIENLRDHRACMRVKGMENTNVSKRREALQASTPVQGSPATHFAKTWT